MLENYKIVLQRPCSCSADICKNVMINIFQNMDHPLIIGLVSLKLLDVLKLSYKMFDSYEQHWKQNTVPSAFHLSPDLNDLLCFQFTMNITDELEKL